MIEVEIKVGISNPHEIQKKLEEHNAVYKSTLYHEDIYFNMPKGLRDFKLTDEALRIRKSIEFNKNDEKKTKQFSYFVTYKGKKVDVLTKTRQEIEIELNDSDKMIEMLNVLDFQKVLTIKKERELYEIEYKGRNLDALIDFIPVLNRYFLEVELLTENPESVEEYRKILFEFLKLIGIHKKESIRESYLELIINNGKI